MTTYIINKQNLNIEIRDQKILFTLLKNNEIISLRSFGYDDNNHYKQLFELLKKNTSGIKLHFTCKNGSNIFYKLLCDYLTDNIYVTSIYLSDKHISVENLRLLSDTLKKNNSLIAIDLNYINLNDNECKYLLDSLKFNETLRYIRMHLHLIDGNHVAELLKVNTILRSLHLTYSEIKDFCTISKALKNNKHIIELFMRSFLGIYLDTGNIVYYCLRNCHNSQLKSLMIQDL
jgi:hypothetical protein